MYIYVTILLSCTVSINLLLISFFLRKSIPQSAQIWGIDLLIWLAINWFFLPSGKWYWAKDIIFLVTDKGALGMNAWLEAYHDIPNPCECNNYFIHLSICSSLPPSLSFSLPLFLPSFIHFTNQNLDCFTDIKSLPLESHSGAIQGAINLEISSSSISSMNILCEGLNGQLPNLDLINMVDRLFQKEMIPSILHTQVCDNVLVYFTNLYKNGCRIIMVQCSDSIGRFYSKWVVGS